MTVTKVRDGVTGHTYSFYGTLQFGVGETYTTAQGGTLLPLPASCKATRTPIMVHIDSPGNSGFVYDYTYGTNAQNGRIKILSGAAAQSGLTELATGAVSAPISSDVIRFRADFAGML